MKRLTSANVGRIFSAIKKNLPDVQAQVVGQVADQFKATVQPKAPPEEILPTYAAGFQSIRISDQTFLVGVVAERMVKTITDADSVAVYFLPATKKQEEMVDPVLLALQAFEPFTLSTLPFKPNPKTIKTVYRKVRADEFLGIQNRIVSNLAKITSVLTRLGLSYQKIEAIEAFEDVEFKVTRAEIVGDPDVKRHWRPALPAISNFYVPEDVSDRLLRGVKGLAKPKPISEDVRKRIDQFQSKIL